MDGRAIAYSICCRALKTTDILFCVLNWLSEFVAWLLCNMHVYDLLSVNIILAGSWLECLCRGTGLSCRRIRCQQGTVSATPTAQASVALCCNHREGKLAGQQSYRAQSNWKPRSRSG